ncbi:MAG: rhomboid family intramembrane serine protease [Spirochaetota bacterium]|nr:rhomboid family intramembrane serine protease [Spirochaetota bacterium]
MNFLLDKENEYKEIYYSKVHKFFKETPITIYIIAVNFFLFILIHSLESETDAWKLGTLNLPMIYPKGEYFRFITAYFLHIHPLHIIFNMFSLFMVGPFIEHIFGKINFFILYMFTGLVSTVSSYLITMPPEAVGASGAIFGIVGGFTTFLIMYKDKLKQDIRKKLLINIFVVVGINLAFGLFSSIGVTGSIQVDNAAHVGGLLSGAIIAIFLKPEALETGKKKISLAIALLYLVIILASFAWMGYTYILDSRKIDFLIRYFK